MKARKRAEGGGEERYKIRGKHGYVLVGEQRNKATRGEKAEGWERALEEWRRREEIQERELFHLVVPPPQKNAAYLISLPLFANHHSLINSFI